jgi:ADP-dependent NAD(P)H-hydrate dehydratase / NAD(P)H-hydrate epimerase
MQTIPLPPAAPRIVTVAAMQALERAADAGGHSYAAMMEQAGTTVAQEILARHAPLLPRPLVLVGPGNNGGDGLVCARVLAEAGAPVRVYLWQRRTEPDHDYEGHYAGALRAGAEAAHADADLGLATLRAWLAEADLVVDALLGTGANRPIEGMLAALLDTVRADLDVRPFVRVAAVDCASGLNCDTGALDPHSLAAAYTVTFAYAKEGHYKFPGAAASGTLIVRDIGIDPALIEPIQPAPTFALTAENVRGWLPQRPRASHKGTFGKVIGAVGSLRYPGAATLSLGAAGRVGAGLVTGAVPEPVLPIAAMRLAEPTWLPLSHAGGALDTEAATPVRAAIGDYNALLLGCGLGHTQATTAFVRALLGGGGLPATLIDADGLNCLAGMDGWHALLPEQCVLTPHPAEFARLLGVPAAEAVARRWELAREAAARWKCVLLVKGPYTVIAAPDGTLAVLPVATPALATAGTGDVLSGTIAGLLAQGVEPFAAACAGAWVHGEAGLLCEEEIGPVGPVAGDLLERLPRVLRRLSAQGLAPRER